MRVTSVNGVTLKSREQAPLARSARWRALAAGTAAAVTLAPIGLASSAVADPVETQADAAAHSHGLFVEGLGLTVAGSAYATAESDNDPGPKTDTLNLALLSSLIDLDLGDVELPLITPEPGSAGLLYLGDLGAISSRASAPSSTEAVGSSGIINEDGSLNVDAASGGDFEPAEIDLTRLLTQLIGAEATDDLIDRASIQIGALGSRVEKVGGETSSEYAVADLKVDVSSPLVADLITTVDGILATVLQPIDDLLGPDGVIGELVAVVVAAIDDLPLISAELTDLSLDTAPLTNAIRTRLIAEGVSNAEGSIQVNLADGRILIDLEQVVMDQYGVDSLNELPPNTEVLSGPIVTSILDGVTEALLGSSPNSLLSKVLDIVEEGIYDITLNLEIEASALLGAVDAPLYVHGTLGGFLGAADHADPVVDVSGLDLLGIPLGQVLQPATSLLTGLVSDLGGALGDVVPGVLTSVQPALIETLEPLLDELLDGALEPVLSTLR